MTGSKSDRIDNFVKNPDAAFKLNPLFVKIGGVAAGLAPAGVRCKAVRRGRPLPRALRQGIKGMWS